MPKNKLLKEFNEKCRRGQHPFKNIFIACVNSSEDHVVRWCPVCGTVVVDADIDGRRTDPGRIMPARRPQIYEILC